MRFGGIFSYLCAILLHLYVNVMRRFISIILIGWSACAAAWSQINTDRVLAIGRNALYFEDYVLSIQYFNEVIKVKPYLAEPYLYRSIAKLYLDDDNGAEQDATECIERNPFIVGAYHVRGIARQHLGTYDEAVEDFETGLKMQPENRAFLRGLASVYAQRRDYHRADSCFNHLVRLFPSDETAYLGRAQLRIEQHDSVGAMNDLNKAIELDKGSSYAYGLRSMIYMDQERYAEAEADLNKAIALDPEQAAFYINRGLVRYCSDNIRGALDDYDTALRFEPNNVIPRYNRGLLRAQIGDRNHAIEDFSAVLRVEPDNTFAAYNRALLRDEVGDYNGAIDDYTTVFESHPNFFPALYARSEDNRKLNRTRAADADYKAAWLLEQQVQADHDKRQRRLAELRAAGVENPDSVLMAETQPGEADDEPDDEARIRRESDRNIRKFNRAMATDLAAGGEDKYGSNSVRGRIQDRNFTVELQHPFVLTYYEKSDLVHQNIYFEKTLSDFNRAGYLSRRLRVVSDEPMLTQDQVQAHFASIDDYSRLLTHSPNQVIFYFGRSLDFMLVQDYQNAIEDLNQVLMRDDNFILAYFNRAVLRLRRLEVQERQGEVASAASGSEDLRGLAIQSTGDKNATAATATDRTQTAMASRRKMESEMVMRDLDKVIELSPTFVYAYFNRASVSAGMNNFDAALADLNKAIELYPSFAEAYYNRGLIFLRTGKTKAGVSDLSKAGELGLAAAYSVLKRANN
jgi:tetratricopeptide (TPR) repeat protein